MLAIFGSLSVVRIASANARSFSTDASAREIRGDKCELIFSVGSGTPMIPVEEGKTCDGLVFSNLAVSMQTALQARWPAVPVAQLAFPELTITAMT